MYTFQRHIIKLSTLCTFNTLSNTPSRDCLFILYCLLFRFFPFCSHHHLVTAVTFSWWAKLLLVQFLYLVQSVIKVDLRVFESTFCVIIGIFIIFLLIDMVGILNINRHDEKQYEILISFTSNRRKKKVILLEDYVIKYVLSNQISNFLIQWLDFTESKFKKNELRQFQSPVLTDFRESLKFFSS